MSAVCPSCGVAVVPGYAKCPKCQTPLPYGRGNARLTTRAGGTAVEDRRFPVIAIAAPLAGIVLLVVLVKMCGGGGGGDEKVTQVATPATPAGPTVVQPRPQTPAGPQPTSTTPTQAAPDTTAASAELDRVLRMKRFWSTIDITGSQVDVRSSSCDDPGMRPLIDGVASVLRGAGLTRLRCVAQSGTVVFERNL